MKNEFVAGFDVNRIDFKHTNNYNDPSGLQFDATVASVDPFNFVPAVFINSVGTVSLVRDRRPTNMRCSPRTG